LDEALKSDEPDASFSISGLPKSRDYTDIFGDWGAGRVGAKAAHAPTDS
jgi:hypothetical protein